MEWTSKLSVKAMCSQEVIISFTGYNGEQIQNRDFLQGQAPGATGSHTMDCLAEVRSCMFICVWIYLYGDFGLHKQQEKRQWEKCISFPGCLVGRFIMNTTHFISNILFIIVMSCA